MLALPEPVVVVEEACALVTRDLATIAVVRDVSLAVLGAAAAFFGGQRVGAMRAARRSKSE